MTGYLLVAAGGAIGAGLRYGIGRMAAARWGAARRSTLLVNLTGAFAIGLLYGLEWPDRRPALALFAGTGILGGYTTFSALKVQTAVLTGSGARRSAVLYTALTYIGGLGLAAAGYTGAKLAAFR